MKKVLAVSAHPDDCEIGCGGTLVKHSIVGDEVTLLVVTNGNNGPGRVRDRIVEQENAAAVLGVTRLIWGGLPDGKVVLFEFDLVQLIEKTLFEMGGADLIYTHDVSDSHQDHRAVAINTLGAARHQPSILCYYAPSSYDFLPNVYVDVSDTIDKKIEALQCHSSQVAASEMVNSERIRAQAMVHGHSARLPAAEAFISKRLVLPI